MNSIDLSSSTNALLLEIQQNLEAAVQLLKSDTFHLVPYTAEVLKHVSSFDEKRMHQLVAKTVNLRQIAEVVRSVSQSQDLSVTEEVNCLKESFEVLGIEFSGSDEYGEMIEPGDIIEIYNHENIQVYRNFQFLKICPYDLLTILAYEWPQLYERAHSVTENLIQTAQSVMEADSEEVRKFDVPSHTLRPILINNAPIYSIEMKYIKQLRNVESGERFGFIVTQSMSSVVAEDAASRKVKYLK